MAMEFRTIIDIKPSEWKINPCERMLFVGSCFADNIGKRFTEEKFRTVVNPYGVMYNPASIANTVQRLIDGNAMPFKADEQGTAVFTLGTNHVYILNETGEIVDNCRKRPQSLFTEKELSIRECSEYLHQAIRLINSRYPLVRFVLTVSPIRYRKYGYHGSQLSKATLLLAIQSTIQALQNNPKRTTNKPQPASLKQLSSSHDPAITTCEPQCAYFPSYEIMNDELRDYRFYKPDMLHPSEQAVEYIFERLAETYFSDETFRFLKEWKPIKEALAHRPFNPESDAYKDFMKQAMDKLDILKKKYPFVNDGM